ncbi:hypothetical protein C7S13_7444 [Burkholderia cepacia]|nr:hypothetical protein [Burkholderia cepacia]
MLDSSDDFHSAIPSMSNLLNHSPPRAACSVKKCEIVRVN